MSDGIIGACQQPTEALRGVASMGYVERFGHNERKRKHGAKQQLCETCMRWRFRDEQWHRFVGIAQWEGRAGDE